MTETGKMVYGRYIGVLFKCLKRLSFMKKLLLSFLVLVPETSLFADTLFDRVNRRFYTTPAAYNIDQNEYHSLCVQIYQL